MLLLHRFISIGSEFPHQCIPRKRGTAKKGTAKIKGTQTPKLDQEVRKSSRADQETKIMSI